jgi:ribose 5-phosphate isomerase A
MEANRMDLAKMNAGYQAAAMVEDGMIVGLGTGSTVLYCIERLAQFMNEGLSFQGVPTSYQAAQRARQHGIALTTLDEYCEIDIAIDGADQVDSRLNLIKGRGAAQTRERCVAHAAEHLVIVVDEHKLAPVLSVAVPIEVLPFAVSITIAALVNLGGDPLVREGIKKDGPVITDNGNWIIDCSFGEIPDPASLEVTINNMPGVISCGIFAEFTDKTTVIVGKKDGVMIFQDEIYSRTF